MQTCGSVYLYPSLVVSRSKDAQRDKESGNVAVVVPATSGEDANSCQR